MENLLTQLGGIAGATAIFAPMITGYIKKIVPKKEYRALISPIVGFVLTGVIAMITGEPWGVAIAMALAGLGGGAMGSSVRDFIKFKKAN